MTLIEIQKELIRGKLSKTMVKWATEEILTEPEEQMELLQQVRAWNHVGLPRDVGWQIETVKKICIKNYLKRKKQGGKDNGVQEKDENAGRVERGVSQGGNVAEESARG